MFAVFLMVAVSPALARDPEGKPNQKQEPPASQAAPAAKATLIFFMNPNGRPCQKQDEILKDSRGQWEALANLRYVRTDVAADRDVFYQYGIRSLPNLILAGPDGKEILRYPPGIQSAESIVSGIKSKAVR